MILRVFPHRTQATPRDKYVRLNYRDLFDGDPLPEIKEVHISVTFTWDIPEGERLCSEYSAIYRVPVKVGGPAFGDPGGEFEPGRYLAPGNVITSRGCPNKCEKCFVPEREGALRELAIGDGWKVHDNNLLACSESHVRAVFDMLSRQKEKPLFVGGLEARRITLEIALALREIRTNRLFVAYDRRSQLKAVIEAGRVLQEVGFTRLHHNHCYILSGFPGDSTEAATRRCREAWEAGFLPYVMLYRDKAGKTPAREWQDWKRKLRKPQTARAAMQAENARMEGAK